MLNGEELVLAEADEAVEKMTEPAESEPKVVPGLEPAGESTSIFSRRRKSPGESANHT